MSFLLSVFVMVMLIILYVKWQYNYFKRRNIPYIQAYLPFGKFGKMYTGDLFKHHYDEFKSKGFKCGGSFLLFEPVYIPTDLEIIKHFLQLFNNRGFYCNEKDDHLSVNLVSLTGSRWKSQRGKLAPAFSSAKIKLMFDTILECSTQLNKAVIWNINRNQPLDVKEAMACFTTDVIGSCAFGIQCKSLQDTNSDFRKYAKEFLNINLLQAIKFLIVRSSWKLGHLLGITLTTKEMRNFFLNTVRENIEYRRKHGIVRKDFVQTLLNYDETFTIEEMTAHIFTFFLAGFETTASTLTFCLFELALNVEIQEKLRREVNYIYKKYDEILTYDALNEMSYVMQVLNETLRKYPPIGALGRTCEYDYQIPGTPFVVPKNTRVIIPVKGLHHDPNYFQNPETFDPERFSEENKKSLIPYTYMPFGEGPRHCIGIKFGLMQAKIGIVTLLRKFRFTLNSRTRLPLQLEPFNIVMTTRNIIWLDMSEVDNS